MGVGGCGHSDRRVSRTLQPIVCWFDQFRVRRCCEYCKDPSSPITSSLTAPIEKARPLPLSLAHPTFPELALAFRHVRQREEASARARANTRYSGERAYWPGIRNRDPISASRKRKQVRLKQDAAKTARVKV